jgi:RecB family endonuclease NucS
MNENIQKLQTALKKNETIVLACECEVVYSGRAEAFLPPGERLVIIKSDGTLLIHQPSGNNPINYMKADTKHGISESDGRLVIASQNLVQKEYLDICISKIFFMQTHPLKDGQKIQIMGTEKDMSEMIYKNPGLIAPDFKPLSMEEHTKYGFIDVFGHDKNGNIVVVECKRYNADLAAVTQLRRYVEKIKGLKGTEKVRGIIAAPKITANAHKMLHDWGFSFVAVEPPKYKERYNKDQKTLGGF